MSEASRDPTLQRGHRRPLKLILPKKEFLHGIRDKSEYWESILTSIVNLL